jgi:type III restriction enzyme
MLQEAKNLQQEAVKKLVAESKDKREIVFKSPTGSGKTYMIADYMNRILTEREDIVFLVSSLSKGDLARQNYEKFCEYKTADFTRLNPYLINSTIAGEERLYIPPEYNVYSLPLSLYKKGGRLMQGVLDAFFLHITGTKMLGGLEKKIVLIKDECHIATSNLDNLPEKYISQIIDLSATPKLNRGQYPNVEITDEAAEAAKLIKTIKWGEENDKLEIALSKFESIKTDYRNKLGVNPCLIIQISNKEKAEEELNNIIYPALNAYPDFKWMLIVDDRKKCDSNDIVKAKKLPVGKWKTFAKDNTASIDIIIFKLTISEGWDIPRACMLYQIRGTDSKQLDEQVMGRVRRNPRLRDFETLPAYAQKLATTAWIWGIKPEGQRKIYGVKLWDEASDITDNIKVKITKLKPLKRKQGFNLSRFIAAQSGQYEHPESIFDMWRKVNNADNEVKQMVWEYATNFPKWFAVARHIEAIEMESNQYLCNYAESMEVINKPVSFAISSHYTDNDHYVRIDNWVWRRRDGNVKFSFDSEAEEDWADILKDLSRSFGRTTVGKKNDTGTQGQVNLFGEVEPDRTEEKEVMLWGKNYVPNSSIKFEYYMGALHSSFPDFVMKDKFGRIHIFEVKSVNISANFDFDNNIYKSKIAELEKCYKQASKLTDQIFYLPILKDDTWKITRFMNGEQDTLTEEQFTEFVNGKK